MSSSAASGAQHPSLPPPSPWDGPVRRLPPPVGWGVGGFGEMAPSLPVGWLGGGGGPVQHNAASVQHNAFPATYYRPVQHKAAPVYHAA